MRNTWIEIDFETLGANVRRLRKTLRPGCEPIFVVKANGYGHGMIEAARCAYASGVRWFGVIGMDEAAALRARLPKAGILIMGPIAPRDVSDAVKGGFTCILADEEHAKSLAAACRRGKDLACHVKIDTGMGRIGVSWERAACLAGRVLAGKGIKITGMCSHFASSDSPDDEFARTQARRFDAALRDCRGKGLTGCVRHISNSGGVQFFPEYDFDAVRVGILLYGYGGGGKKPRVQTRPILMWKTRVVQVKSVPPGFAVGYGSEHRTSRRTGIATLDVGYSDGYCRALGNKAFVLIGGRRFPVVGRVSMNFTTVEVGPSSGVRRGDEAVLIGRQGSVSVWADELAALAGTIPYEILTNIRRGRPACQHGEAL